MYVSLSIFLNDEDAEDSSLLLYMYLGKNLTRVCFLLKSFAAEHNVLPKKELLAFAAPGSWIMKKNHLTSSSFWPPAFPQNLPSHHNLSLTPASYD